MLNIGDVIKIGKENYVLYEIKSLPRGKKARWKYKFAEFDELRKIFYPMRKREILSSRKEARELISERRIKIEGYVVDFKP